MSRRAKCSVPGRSHSVLAKQCAECGAVLAKAGRGRWSPFFCGPCDEGRKRRICAAHKELRDIFANPSEPLDTGGPGQKELPFEG